MANSKRDVPLYKSKSFITSPYLHLYVEGLPPRRFVTSSCWNFLPPPKVSPPSFPCPTYCHVVTSTYVEMARVGERCDFFSMEILQLFICVVVPNEDFVILFFSAMLGSFGEHLTLWKTVSVVKMAVWHNTISYHIPANRDAFKVLSDLFTHGSLEEHINW